MHEIFLLFVRNEDFITKLSVSTPIREDALPEKPLLAWVKVSTITPATIQGSLTLHFYDKMHEPHEVKIKWANPAEVHDPKTGKYMWTFATIDPISSPRHEEFSDQEVQEMIVAAMRSSGWQVVEYDKETKDVEKAFFRWIHEQFHEAKQDVPGNVTVDKDDD